MEFYHQHRLFLFSPRCVAVVSGIVSQLFSAGNVAGYNRQPHQRVEHFHLRPILFMISIN